MAERDLASLVVKLTAQTAQYEKKLDNANRKLSKFEKSTNASLGKIQNSFSSFNRSLAAIGVGFSLIGVTRGLASAAAKAIEYGDEINKASQKTGIAAGAFSELAYAAKQQDIGLDALGAALKKYQVTVSEAGSGNKSALSTFQALGVNFNELRQLAPEKQFEIIAEQISRLQDPADRTRAAVELFGRAGADLLPLFSEGAEGIRKAREEAVKMGAALSDEQIKKLADADDAIKRLESSWAGFARTLTAAVAPALTKVLDLMSGANADTGRIQQIEALLASRGNLPDSMFPDSADLRRELARLREQQRRRLLGGGRQATRSGLDAITSAPSFSGGGSGASGSGRGPSRAALAGLSEVAITVERITTSATEQLYREMDEATQTSMQRQLAEWEKFDQQVATLVADGIISAQEGAKRITENNASFLEPIEVTAEKITVVAEKAVTVMSEFAKQASANVQDVFAEFLFDPFSGGLDDMVANFGRAMQRIAAEAAASQFMKFLFGAGIGSGGGVLGGLFDGFFASGGTIKPGHFGIVGERGPELAYAGSSAMKIEPMGGGNTFNFSFAGIREQPGGGISQATRMQLTAAVARGVADANRRNN